MAIRMPKNEPLSHLESARAKSAEPLCETDCTNYVGRYPPPPPSNGVLPQRWSEHRILSTPTLRIRSNYSPHTLQSPKNRPLHQPAGIQTKNRRAMRSTRTTRRQLWSDAGPLARASPRPDARAASGAPRIRTSAARCAAGSSTSLTLPTSAARTWALRDRTWAPSPGPSNAPRGVPLALKLFFWKEGVKSGAGRREVEAGRCHK